MPPSPHTTTTVVSKDGTTIGYRQLGTGPGLVLLHGGMMAAQNFMRLAAALSDDFTVTVPDRRGRGASGSFARGHGLQAEVDDLAAVLAQTGARDVFGLSSGAIIAMEAALRLPGIDRLAIYEPPLSVDGVDPAAWLPRYDEEIAAGDLPAAMVTLSKGVPVSPVFSRLPRLLGTALMRLAIPADAQQTQRDDVPLQALIPTMHYDAQVVTDAAGDPSRYRALAIDVLLLGGSKSPPSLTRALDVLAGILPHAERIEIPRVGHMAADNGGQPERVAAVLLPFFRRSKPPGHALWRAESVPRS
jgi:pimeloyl-ACP methyl ester carboxylesterase